MPGIVNFFAMTTPRLKSAGARFGDGRCGHDVPAAGESGMRNSWFAMAGDRLAKAQGTMPTSIRMVGTTNIVAATILLRDFNRCYFFFLSRETPG
ncbi:MAG: hypothetical protein K9G60_07355 [Pseudolabrys sp.]|nr:hypothetical protein [Pseudolabrys sp.]